MKDIDARLRRLEQHAEQERQRHDPQFALKVELDDAWIDWGVAAGEDGSPERQAQEDRIAAILRALDTGDTSGLELTCTAGATG